MNKRLLLLIQLQRLILGGNKKTKGRIDCLRSYIPSEHLIRFDGLLANGRPTVAIVTKAGVCGGCRFRLSQRASWIVRRARDQIHTCHYCGCFLYVSPEDGTL
jgi:predicted  nucleic acid-binding Zn-ribbon protein